MKMIDVLNMMAEGKIKEGTKLITDDDLDDYEYRYSEVYQTFMDRYMINRIEDDFFLDEDFLNIEVKLIQPKPKKYYLRLDGDDSFSYINMTMYAAYEAATKDEFLVYNKTKFAQEEIDNDKLLKFVEQYGIKEEVEENEID